MQAPETPEVFRAQPRRMSRAEYDRIAALGFFHGERVELIHGIVVRMPPIGPPHSEIVDRLTLAFVPALANRARVRIQQPLLAWDESEPEPDVAIVPSKSYAATHPSEAFLVVEVSETSLDYDRETKAPLYAASNVAEYWVVDIASKTIEVFSSPVDGRYETVRRVGAGDMLSPGAFPEIVLTVSDLLTAS